MVSGEHEIRELATPLISSSQPAGSLQQVMSPTLGYGTAGHGTNVSSVTPDSSIARREGGLGFAQHVAAGRALESTGQSGTAEPDGVQHQVSTTSDGGIVGTQGVQMPGQTPGGSPGLEANTGMSGTASSEALPGGRVVAGDSTGEGFVTPRSQQGLPTIAEMVEGFPVSGRQLMTRVGDFFQVARTEVMQVPVWQDSHVTPPRSTTRSTGNPDGALGNLALGEGSLGSHGSSPPQVGSLGTPASFAPPPPPGREGSLLSADVLQRMHALEQRAPHLYGQPFDRPQSRSNSSSLPQEAIQAEVARQLAGFDQRAQVQELEIQRLRRQLEEEKVMREQVMREAALASPGPTAKPHSIPGCPTSGGSGPASGYASGPGYGSPSSGPPGLCHQAFPPRCPGHRFTTGSSGIRLGRTGKQHFRRCNHVSLARRYRRA